MLRGPIFDKKILRMQPKSCCLRPWNKRIPFVPKTHIAVKRCLLVLVSCALLLVATNIFAEIQRIGTLERVPAIPPRSEWDRFKILVYRHKTSVLDDFDLYRRAALGGFHIDRGAGWEKYVAFSLEKRFPYYVDHAADKGFLYLTGGKVNAVLKKHGLATRPFSLADPETIEKMKSHMTGNIGATRKGLVLAYAFDDEISLGSFVRPCDVDKHPLSLEWFRKWLTHEYGPIDQLNKEWGTAYKTYQEVMPKSFEGVRGRAQKPPLSGWNLAPWMDFRRFMDFQFGSVLSELTRYTNKIDPKTPAGFVGGQGPGPYGGYDYAMLSRSVQWMEAYDVHGTNEILRSFWNREHRPRMQTFFSKKNAKLDSWFLWYYMLHGNRGVIAWPEGWFRAEEYDIAPWILELKDTFEEVQGPISEVIADTATVFDSDPIGIYYSHPSLQAGWAMDAITHGKTWVSRGGSIDDVNQTAGVLRKVWCKTLEDLGFQYDFISYLDVQEGLVNLNKRFKVIILPRTVCLSDTEARALKSFVMEGGTLIADYLCGLMDEHGKGRSKGVLDGLFGIQRDESEGYMNGKGLTEIDGEKFQQSFLERFTHYDGVLRYKDMAVFERGTRPTKGTRGVECKSVFGLVHKASVLMEKQAAKGRAVYLNLSPVEYWDPSRRFSAYGHEWRKIILEIVNSSGLEPRVKVYEGGNAANMLECLFWKNGAKHYLGLIKNPTMEIERSRIGDVQGVMGEATEIRLEFREEIALVNLRTKMRLGRSKAFRDRFRPWEGNLYEVIY